MSEVVIRAKNIKKSYRHYKNNWQKVQFLLFMRDTGRKMRVLSGITFEIKKGEKVGIIGRSLSGRSTLMKIICGVIRQDSGVLEVNGNITPVLDHKMGFIMTMPGLDNYRQRAAIEGWTKEQIKEHEDAVFDFAGLTNDKEKPIKLYRKGRINRLGFTISTEFKPDIMIYDELFSFGSKPFSDKAVARLKDLIKGEDTTFVMTVNNVPLASRLCERGLVMHKGRIVFDGPFDEAIEYFETNLKKTEKKDEPDEDRARSGEGEVPAEGAGEGQAEGANESEIEDDIDGEL